MPIVRKGGAVVVPERIAEKRFFRTALTFALAILAFPAFADTVAAQNTAPEQTIRLTTLGPSDADAPAFDFGPVARGQKMTHVFTLRNDTKTPVQIDRIESFCECTTAVVLNDPKGRPTLAPGDTVQIKASLDTSRLPQSSTTLAGGQPERQLLVYVVGQPVHAAAVLILRARITDGVSFDPPTIDFGNVDDAMGTKRVVRVAYDPGLFVPGKTRLTAFGDARVRVVSIDDKSAPNNQHLAGQITRVYRVVVVPDAAIGPLSGALRVTGLDRRPNASTAPGEDSVAYVGTVTGKVAAEPANVVFGKLRANDITGKPLPQAQRDRQRVRWILLSCPRLPQSVSAAYWKHATVSTPSPFLTCKLVVPGSSTAPVVQANWPAGTICWLQVSILASVPRGKLLDERIVVAFSDKERLELPVTYEIE